MPRFPIAEQAFITYAKDRSDQWNGGQSGPPDVGLSATQLADTTLAVSEAQAAYSAMLVARGAARDATQLKNVKLEALRAIFGADVDTIDAYAKATGDASIYALAGIPAPKDPSERTAPGAPSDLKATLQLDGSIVLSFKGATGGGAQYHVQRQTTGTDNVTSAYAFMGFADDEKKFVDSAVPEGLKSVGYRVAARLSTGLMSPWSVTYTVPFGSQSTNPAGSIAPVKGEDMKGTG